MRERESDHETDADDLFPFLSCFLLFARGKHPRKSRRERSSVSETGADDLFRKQTTTNGKITMTDHPFSSFCFGLFSRGFNDV